MEGREFQSLMELGKKECWAAEVWESGQSRLRG